MEEDEAKNEEDDVEEEKGRERMRMKMLLWSASLHCPAFLLAPLPHQPCLIKAVSNIGHQDHLDLDQGGLSTTQEYSVELKLPLFCLTPVSPA